MDILDLLVKIGAIGVVLGALLASVSFLYKSRLSNLAALKECLYQLIELERSIMMAKSLYDKSVLDLYWEVVQEEAGDSITPKELKEAKEVSKALLNSSFGATVSHDHEKLEEGFNSSVARLASISPVLASRLNSNIRLRTVVSAIDLYYENFRAHPKVRLASHEISALEEVNSIYKYRLMGGALYSLRSDILHVALRCGTIDFIRLYFTSLEDAKADYEEYRREEIRAFIRELKETLERHAKET